MAEQTAEKTVASRLLPRTEADDVRKELTQIWQDLLGVSSIAPDQNYFDLGGDSPLAVQLFARIEKSFHIKLPLATLFEAPTIEGLAELLGCQATVSGWSPIVPIQPKGSRSPFFCMHGAGGNVLIYRDLAAHLSSEQPFYGLQSPGMDGSCAPLSRVEDMAALYAREIRRIQPHGPYYLGGYCLGGTIAFEVARQLQARGERIALLALFDTLNWCKIPLPSFWSKTYHAFERVVFHTANVLRLDSAGKARFLSEKVKILRARLPVWQGMLLGKFRRPMSHGTSNSTALSKIWQANDKAAMDYVPKPFLGTVTDFRPMRQYRWFCRPGTKWEALAEEEKSVVLPVYPAGMLVEPFVKHLAEALDKAIQEAIVENQDSNLRHAV